MTPAGDLRGLAAEVDRCIAAGRLADAEPALNAITRGDPRAHYAWALLGRIALERGEADAAASLAQRALALDRGNAEYLNLLGVAHGERGALDEALGALRKAARARPAYAEAHFNIGKALEKQGDLNGALAAFRRAAALDPRYPGARYMHGRALFRLGEFDAASAILEAAIADDPADDWCIVMLGRAAAAAHGHAAAIDLYRAAARRLPGSGMLARNLAHALLAAGELREGWTAYLRRDCAGPAPRAALPERLPDDLSGRTLCLRPEQGLGDVLFFLRFAATAAERGARVVVISPPQLASLLGRVPLFACAVSDGAPASAVGGSEIVVADLPYVLDSDAMPAALPLAALPARVDAWRALLAAFGPAPYVGVTWRAGTDFRRRAEFGANIQSLFKEVPAAALAGALRGARGSLVSLQRLPDPGEVDAFAAAAGRPVLDAGAANDDLEEALGLLAVLDEYAGVSNTNTHLRAGLGRTAHVLAPYPPEWRWMAEGERSPWFPGFDVYRIAPARSPEDVLIRLAAALSGGPAA